jgi:hypothetical protein
VVKSGEVLRIVRDLGKLGFGIPSRKGDKNCRFKLFFKHQTGAQVTIFAGVDGMSNREQVTIEVTDHKGREFYELESITRVTNLSSIRDTLQGIARYANTGVFG